MKKLWLVAVLFGYLPLHGCGSEDTSKWQVGTELYYEDGHFGTIIEKQGDSKKIQTPESDFNRPAIFAQDRASYLAGRGVYSE